MAEDAGAGRDGAHHHNERAGTQAWSSSCDKAAARLMRWTFDLAGNSDAIQETPLDDLDGEFPRVDARVTGHRESLAELAKRRILIDGSAADGILDDETYDWLPVVGAMADGHGSPVTAHEHHVVRANELGVRATGVDASPTGTAGLAGLLAAREHVADDERVAVIFSGVRR